MAKHTLNVSLTGELEEAIQRYVDSGLFTSQSEVVRAGLRLLIERDEERAAKLENLRGKISSGLSQVEAGDSSPLSADEIKSRGRARLGIE
jgi:antitoxin ParD1/3/4